MQILLSLFYFFYFSVVGVYLIFMPKVLLEMGYSAQEIGIIFAAGPLVRFILPFLFLKGMRLDTKVFKSALFIMSASAISFYLNVEDFYALLASNIALGVGLSLVLPYVEVVSLDIIGKERYGKIRLFGSFGFVLVALVLVKLLSSAEIALLFLLILTMVTAIVAYLIGTKVAKVLKQSEDDSNDMDILRDYKLWLGLILMQVSFGAFYNFFTIYATESGISMQNTIYLWSFGVVAEILMLYTQGRFLRNNLLFILQLTTLVTAFRWYLLYAFVENISVLYFSQALHAFSFALFHSAAIAYLYSLYKHKSLAQQFFSGLAYGLGGLSGALLSGFIYEHYPNTLFLSASLLAFISFLFFVAWGRDVKDLGKSQNL